MSVSAGKVLVKSENGNGMLKLSEVTAQPFFWQLCPPKRPREEHNDIRLPVGRLFTLTAALLCNSRTLLLAQHFSTETVSANSINQALCQGSALHICMQIDWLT